MAFEDNSYPGTKGRSRPRVFISSMCNEDFYILADDTTSADFIAIQILRDPTSSTRKIDPVIAAFISRLNARFRLVQGHPFTVAGEGEK